MTRTKPILFEGKQPHRKFHELAHLDAGSFGAEDAFYKLVREVVIMEKLYQHENIVACHEAWFEGPLKKKFNSEWLKLLKSNKSPPTPNERLPTSVSEEEVNTYMCIRMELMDKDINLAAWYNQNLDKIGNFETTVKITKPMLASLATIHAEGIIHRDLNPNNILLNVRGDEIIVKIADFGLSREIPTDDSALSGHVGGVYFTSPEIERGDRDYTFKTDIFSLGLIVLVMLHPFCSNEELKMGLDDVRHGCSRILQGFLITQPRIYDLLRTMLNRKPEERPTAEEALTVVKIISSK
ncbi:putative serine/threonine-protein kinase GCN2 [Folsomia candida]|uniref:Putative serine/threonine-protein kinase GCN2 n=2 Tax=Folsomia candida TaxID=158441 RepID=A0A226F407_FOLCA|nr:putative serine/threonine-protein kinase GCN2 [Folsomia candida]